MFLDYILDWGDFFWNIAQVVVVFILQVGMWFFYIQVTFELVVMYLENLDCGDVIWKCKVLGFFNLGGCKVGCFIFCIIISFVAKWHALTCY